MEGSSYDVFATPYGCNSEASTCEEIGIQLYLRDSVFGFKVGLDVFLTEDVQRRMRLVAQAGDRAVVMGHGDDKLSVRIKFAWRRDGASEAAQTFDVKPSQITEDTPGAQLLRQRLQESVAVGGVVEFDACETASFQLQQTGMGTLAGNIGVLLALAPLVVGLYALTLAGIFGLLGPLNMWMSWYGFIEMLSNSLFVLAIAGAYKQFQPILNTLGKMGLDSISKMDSILIIRALLEKTALILVLRFAKIWSSQIPKIG